MRLRSNCTSHKCSTRRRLRMAFAVALAAAPSMALAVEKLPHSPPIPLNHSQLDHPQHREAGLLPYPFGPSNQCDSVQPEQKLERLVNLVGLQRDSLPRAMPGHQPSAATCDVAQATLNQASMPAIHLQAATSQVVPASGTQSVRPHSDESGVTEPNTLALPSLTPPPAVPAIQLTEASVSLPALASTSSSKSLPSTASQPAVAAATAQAAEDFDELSQSLIDIAIPLEMMQPAQSSQLSEATAISLESPSVADVPDLPTVVAVSPDRQPELIQPAKSLSLTTRQPASQSVNLSLKDTPQASPPAASSAASNTASVANKSAQTYALSDATLDNERPSERGVALHLSSASQVPMKAASMTMGASGQSQMAQRGTAMQVRIEGEPAPLLTGRMTEDISSMVPAAPLPSMERLARLTTAARTEQYEPGHKVKAAFATRTSILPSRDLERSMNTLSRDTKPTSQPLTLGLQESQTLSAQFVITELSVEHPNICQLMQTGENSVSLVGLRPGATRIALVMVNDTGERQVEIHEVSVTSATATAQNLPDMANEISRAVGRLVPNSDVEVVAYEDYLLVHGFTHYESDAKKILSLVRKTSLVPVVDQLKSNEQ